MDRETGRLSFREKCGYGSAAIGDAVAYMFVTTFVMFFLTTVVGLEPAIAGTLTAIGAVWNAFINPIIGYISDNASTRWGRRRPFMIGFCVPLLIVIVLLFTAIEVTYTLKVVFYGLMIIGFWTSFTGFFVPFYALGAEYTRNYDERATLRAYAAFFNMIGTLFSMAMPTMMVKLFSDSGMSVSRAWQLTALFQAVITVTSILITAFAAKDKDICDMTVTKPKEKFSFSKMFREYLEVLKLAPMKWLLLTSLFYLMAYSMIMSDFVYLLTFNLGYDGNGVSMAMAARSLLIIGFIPLVNKLTTQTDKRTAQLIILFIGIVGLTVMRFTAIKSIVVLAVFLFISALTTQTYWQIMPAIFYDVCEYDEYTTGKRREGAVVSVQGLVEAAASGFGAQLLGIILQFAGFDGSAVTQSPEALEWVYNCTTWVPAIFLAFAGFALYKFPITKKRYKEITEELEKEKNNEC